MGDFATGLILMLLMFGLPELLRKRKRPQDYEYPDIPDETKEPSAHIEQPAIRPTIIPPLPDSTAMVSCGPNPRASRADPTART